MAADIAGTWLAVGVLVNVPVVLAGLVLPPVPSPGDQVRTCPSRSTSGHVPSRGLAPHAARPAPPRAGGGLAAVDVAVAGGVPLRGGGVLRGGAAGRPRGPYAACRRASLFALTSLRRGLLLVLPFSIGSSGFMFVIAARCSRAPGWVRWPPAWRSPSLAVVFFGSRCWARA
ncbi:hypothetical protein [Actinoallomurus acanthiterrae]